MFPKNYIVKAQPVALKVLLTRVDQRQKPIDYHIRTDIQVLDFAFTISSSLALIKICNRVQNCSTNFNFTPPRLKNGNSFATTLSL